MAIGGWGVGAETTLSNPENCFRTRFSMFYILNYGVRR